MADWIPIVRYSEFYDVPRVILLRLRGRLVFLESRFNEEIDDYEQTYHAYILPEMTVDDIWARGTKIASLAEKAVGEIPVERLLFDETRRREIRADSLSTLEL